MTIYLLYAVLQAVYAAMVLGDRDRLLRNVINCTIFAPVVTFILLTAFLLWVYRYSPPERD